MQFKASLQNLPKILLLLMIFLSSTLNSQASAVAGLAATQGLDFSPIVSKAKAAVVSINIYVKQTMNQFDFSSGNPLLDQFLKQFYGMDPDQFRQYQQKSKGGNKVLRQLGSGVIFKEDGSILTNNHVIKGGDMIEVVLNDGRKADAKIIGSDPLSDVGLLKIDIPNIKNIEVGDSDKIKEGNVVFAIGNPLGIGISVSMGIISALQRKNINITEKDNFIQTDAAINRGNSGGPLIDINGNLIGINTAILSQSGGSEGIGFAIPINQAMRSVNEILKYGRVKAPFLGVYMQDLGEDLAKNYGLKEDDGVLIVGVQPNGPADEAGIKRKDIVTSFDGKKVKSMEELRDFVRQKNVGDSVEVELLRKKKKMKVNVKIGDNEQSSTVSSVQNNSKKDPTVTDQLLGGIRVVENEYINTMYGIKGVKIKEVANGSAAAKAGLQKDDVILEISDDGKDFQLDSVEDFVQAQKEFKKVKDLQLLVERGGMVHVLVLNRNNAKDPKDQDD